MNENDRRVRRTQRLLSQALFELMQEKGYDNVTIRDITERADIAYATFFRHYKSKDEILLNQVDESLRQLEPLVAQLQGNYFLHVGMLVFEHMQQNSEFYRRLFESASFSRQLRLRVAENLLLYAKQRLAVATLQEPPIPVEVVANHMAAGQLALMEWWLNNRQRYSPQRMAEIYDQLIMRASYAALGVEVPPPTDGTAPP
jgi:AcrR family transcriptional regulator